MDLKNYPNGYENIYSRSVLYTACIMPIILLVGFLISMCLNSFINCIRIPSSQNISHVKTSFTKQQPVLP